MDVAGARTQVLFITGANPMRGGGGLESYVRAHAHAANAAGFESHVFCVGRGARSTHESFGVVHQVAVPPHSPRGFLAGLYSPGVARAALAHLARVERGPVLIHAFGPYGCGGARIARSLERRGQHAVLVTSAYNTQEQENHAFLMGLRREHGLRNRVDYLTRYGAVRLIGTRNERRGYASSRLLLVNYESVRTLLRDEFGAGWEIRLMPYASDTAFATTDSVAVPEPVLALEPRAAPLIVSVSRHDPRKGVDVLLRALAELRDQGVGFRACLLGRGELIDAHRRLAANLRLDRSVAITDQVPDVVPYLRKADIYVLPSVSRPWPRTATASPRT
jgi:glycosyltransferase involved in cell wall biosynthesis